MRLFAAAVLLFGSGAPRQEPDATARLLDALERRHRETVNPADPRAAAARLGYDRAKILDFVTRLAWEPYPGILRDSAGTLLCGGGNSVDRALTLQSMLEAAGEKTRLMRVDVAAEDAAKLLDSFRKRDRKDRPEKEAKVLAGELGLDPAALEAALAERRRAESDLVDEILEAARVEAARVAPLLGLVPGRPAETPREHVWVQVESKAGWVDLDPSPLPLPRQGGRPMTPAEIAAQRRTVTIRLVLNRKSGGKIEAIPLLTVPSDLAAVSWKAVDLLIQPVPGQLPTVAKLRELEAKAAVEAFLKVKQYRPGLIIDGKSYGGIPFDVNGATYDVDAGGQVGTAKKLAGGVGKAFGGLGGGLGGGGEEAAPASTLESVVLEVAVAERVHKRLLVGPAKAGERALPILRYSFLVDGAPLPQGERGRRELAAYVRNAPALRRLIKRDLAGVHFNQHVEVPSLLLRFADLRRRALIRLGEGAAYVQARPGVVLETSQVCVDADGSRLLHRRGIDIMENPGAFDGAGDRTTALGIAETVLECLLVERGWPGESGRSAWTLIERARLQGGKGEAADRGGLREVRWSPDAWWSVDPASGACVGRVPSGAGQALIEAAWEQASAVCTYSDVIGFAAAMGSSSKLTTQEMDDAAALFGKACGVAGGTWARDAVNDKINEITQGLWTGAIAALSGM